MKAKNKEASSSKNKDSHSFNSSSNSSFVSIPSYVFKDRSLKVLEVLVEFLKEKQNLTYHEIAVLLNRDDRTIWTVYSRAKKKRTKKGSKEIGEFGK